MVATSISAVLFDFFGTLVGYSPSRLDQGYPRSYGLLGELGAAVSYSEFLAGWFAVSDRFDRRSDADDSEFSMTELGEAYLAEVLPAPPVPADVARFVGVYVAEWSVTVVYPPGIADLIGELAALHRLAIVTNTHDAALVPNHLAAMGIAGFFETVVTSVELGRRKPHPAIYAEALGRLGVPAAEAVFVGDTFGPDYAGPERAGMRAFLIDPSGRHDIPAGRRLGSVFDLPARL